MQARDTNDRPFVFRYRYTEVIGNGTFGIVCRAVNLDSGETVAIKTVFQDSGHQNRELGIIKSLQHVNVVQLLGYFYTSNEARRSFSRWAKSS